MNNSPLVSIIAPAHNEELIIEDFIKDVVKSCKKNNINYELIVVENGSSDSTAEKVSRISKANSKIRLIRLDRAGYGLAIIEGLKNSRGEYVVLFNVDFWDEKFLLLTKVALLNYDIVSGSKLLPGSKDYRSLSRRLVSRGFTEFLKLFLGFKGTDTHGIKAIKMRTVSSVIKKCKLRSGIFDSELILRLERERLKILELPVEVREIRPARFNLTRPLKTPIDIYQLWKALK